MNSANNISDAGLYTDFSGLQKLRTKVSGDNTTVESQSAIKEVAKQFESLFLQMMLKSMRDATPMGESGESDQTRFYQEMFDKQIALDLANGDKGGGLGIAELLEKDMGGSQQLEVNQVNNQQLGLQKSVADESFDLIRNQVSRSTSSLQTQSSTNSE